MTLYQLLPPDDTGLVYTSININTGTKMEFPILASKGNVQEIVRYIGQNFLDFQESVREILPYTANFLK